MQLTPDLLLYIPVLLFSLSVHEFAHAWSAKLGGDLTATYQGRLTINPIAHIDPVGTVLLPVVSILMSGFPLIFWAKPVPVNTLRLKSSIWYVYVSLAGPASNIIIALVTMVVMRVGLMAVDNPAVFFLPQDGVSGIPAIVWELGTMMLGVNILLAVFNMIPIPPLDGSSLVYHFIIRPRWHLHAFWAQLQQFGFVILLVMIQIPGFRALLATAYGTPLSLIYRWILG